MTVRAHRFVEANRASPVVYGSCSVDGRGRPTGGCFYRLADNSTWDLQAEDCQAIAGVRWAHLEAVAA